MTRGGPEALRSQLALEVGLVVYAALSSLLLIRVALRLIGIGDLTWTGQIVFSITDPLLAPLGLFAAASRPLAGEATLGDLTALGIIALIPLTLLFRDRAS